MVVLLPLSCLVFSCVVCPKPRSSVVIIVYRYLVSGTGTTKATGGKSTSTRVHPGGTVSCCVVSDRLFLVLAATCWESGRARGSDETQAARRFTVLCCFALLCLCRVSAVPSEGSPQRGCVSTHNTHEHRNNGSSVWLGYTALSVHKIGTANDVRSDYCTSTPIGSFSEKILKFMPLFKN